MFVPFVDEENYIEDMLTPLYKNSYLSSPDILESLRNIVVYSDLDMSRSEFEGIHAIKCTIINTSVLDAKFHHDTVYNPDRILCKTVYHGYMYVKLDKLDKDFKLTDTMLSESKFTLVNAYSSQLALWSVYEENDHFAPIGLSYIDMGYIHTLTNMMRNTINIGADSYSNKIDICFDSDTYKTILPIPEPQYYSRHHAENNRATMTITEPLRMNTEILCDEHTKVSKVDFDRIIPRGDLDYRYDWDKTSETLYLGHDGKVVSDLNENLIPIVAALPMHTSLCDDLFETMFAFFNRYQLSSMDFTYDSRRKILLVPSMKFSYENAPKGFAETAIMEFINERLINESLVKFHDVYRNVMITGRITDLKFDLYVTFEKSHSERTDLKTVRYRSSIFDIMTSLMTSFNTSVTEPIVMI